MQRSLSMAILLLPLLACTRAQVKESNSKWANGLVVANKMCATDGSVQHTKDPEGMRIYCGFEELVGSHIPKCICRDESDIAYRREEAQQYLRDQAQVAQLKK